MTEPHDHEEHHYIHRIGWLRAAVLGANDGIVSTASLIVGVAASAASPQIILLTGVAALVAGAMSMAAGEYVSVSSQSDTECADLETERQALKDNPKGELKELAGIYRARGLSADLSMQVARELTAHDALEAHARDELGLTEIATAQPIQAAVSSAASFAIGASLPLAAAIIAPAAHTMYAVAISSLIALIILGLASAKAGGASKLKAVIRIVFWGAAAMLATAAVGHLFGVSV